MSVESCTKLPSGSKVVVVLAFIVAGCCHAVAQPTDTLNAVSHASTLTFVNHDGSCVRGTVVKADSKTITVEPFKQPQIVLNRTTLMQVSQGNALIYSARSSWKDVADVHLYPGEALVLKTKNGSFVKGSPLKVTSDAITLKHGLKTSRFTKAEIGSVDYLRLKPATDGFNLALEEAPYALFLYPEFYYRVFRLEGRIPVRLYDASVPEDDRVIEIKTCRPTD